MTSRLPALLCIAVLALAGCRDETTPAESNTEATPRVASLGKTTPRKAPAAPEEKPFHVLKFELLEAGASPRAALRYQLAGERAVRASSEASLTMVGIKAGPAADAKASLTTALALTTTPVGDTLRMKVVGLPTSDSKHPSAGDVNALVNGATGTAVLSARGLLQSMRGESSIDARRELTAMLVRYLVPLPAEDIGVGARWRVKYALGRGGIYVAHTLTYRLAKRDGQRLEVEVSLSDSAEPQPIMRNGAVVADLVALRTEGQGRLVVNLDEVVASSGTLSIDTTFHAKSKAAPAATPSEVFRESKSSIQIRSASPDQTP